MLSLEQAELAIKEEKDAEFQKHYVKFRTFFLNILRILSFNFKNTMLSLEHERHNYDSKDGERISKTLC